MSDWVQQELYAGCVDLDLHQTFFINCNDCTNILRRFTNEDNVSALNQVALIIFEDDAHHMHSMSRLSKPLCHGFSILSGKKLHGKIDDDECSFIIKAFNNVGFILFLMNNRDNVAFPRFYVLSLFCQIVYEIGSFFFWQDGFLYQVIRIINFTFETFTIFTLILVLVLTQLLI